ncbi:M48 family peptidase, partial [bacterium]|nr:M48 family peptidase [bacterium]
QEREADRFAVELSGMPDALASSLIKMSRDNLANLHPHPLYAAVYYSHPPVVDRVQGLLAESSKAKDNAG